MGVADCQRLLAALYTDPEFRRSFFDDPARAGASFGLAEEELRHFAGLQKEQVERFAASLVAKRRRAVAKLLPLTSRMLGPRRFASLFGRFAAHSVPAGPHRHRSDAIAFARFLRGVDTAEPGYNRDVPRYEEAQLLASMPGRRFLARFFRSSIRAASQSGGAGPPRGGPSLAAWFRVRPGGPMRSIVIAAPPGLARGLATLERSR